MAHSILIRIGVVLISGAALASPALAEGDAAKGKKVYNKCKICHAVNKEQNRIGPHLVGLMGRKAGAVEKYKYSKAMKESGITWNDETLTKYLAKPKKFVPGTKMAFAGLRKASDLENLLAYLKEATKKP